MNPVEGEFASPPVRYCARHPKDETLLTCGRCETPICPRCMVYTPTGIRCPTCAPSRKLPQYELTPQTYLRIVPGAVALALLIGFASSFVGLGIGFIGGIVVGLLVAAGLKRVSGYKQGREMEIIAGATVVLTVLAGNVFSIARLVGFSHIGSALHLALSQSVLGGDLLGILVGIYFAVMQLR